MAGTRLAIQAIFVAQLIPLIWAAVYLSRWSDDLATFARVLVAWLSCVPSETMDLALDLPEKISIPSVDWRTIDTQAVFWRSYYRLYKQESDNFPYSILIMPDELRREACEDPLTALRTHEKVASADVYACETAVIRHDGTQVRSVVKDEQTGESMLLLDSRSIGHRRLDFEYLMPAETPLDISTCLALSSSSTPSFESPPPLSFKFLFGAGSDDGDTMTVSSDSIMSWMEAFAEHQQNQQPWLPLQHRNNETVQDSCMIYSDWTTVQYLPIQEAKGGSSLHHIERHDLDHLLQLSSHDNERRNSEKQNQRIQVYLYVPTAAVDDIALFSDEQQGAENKTAIDQKGFSSHAVQVGENQLFFVLPSFGVEQEEGRDHQRIASIMSAVKAFVARRCLGLSSNVHEYITWTKISDTGPDAPPPVAVLPSFYQKLFYQRSLTLLYEEVVRKLRFSRARLVAHETRCVSYKSFQIWQVSVHKWQAKLKIAQNAWKSAAEGNFLESLVLLNDLLRDIAVMDESPLLPLNNGDISIYVDLGWNQYAAILAPLLVPLTLPILVALAREIKRYYKKTQKKQPP